MSNSKQFSPDSLELTGSGNISAFLYELKLVLQQAQSALLRARLEEIYASTARLKAITRGLSIASKVPKEDISQVSNKIHLSPEITKLKLEIQRESLLYGSLIRRKQKTIHLLSRMLSNSDATYSQQLGH